MTTLPASLEMALRDLGVREPLALTEAPDYVELSADFLLAHRAFLRSGRVQRDGDTEGPY